MQRKRWIHFPCHLIFLMSVLFLCSCTTTTGTKISHTQNTLSKINKIGIIVNKENEFSVRLSRDKMTTTSTCLFGLLGYAIEHSARANIDQNLANEFRPQIGIFNPEKHMEEKLLYYLQSAKVFRAVEIGKAEDHALLKKMQFDAVLKITIKEWGLRLCVGADKKEQLQAGIDIHALLIEHGTTIWERNELYIDRDCHSLEELRSQKEIVENNLARAVDDLSARIVNEICFP